MNERSTHDPLKEAYALLQASSPSDLARKFIEEDQRLLKAQQWDYTNRELVLNKVKEIVERRVEGGLVTDDKDMIELRDILWFWYHHATGLAIWGQKNKTEALEFSDKALKYQTSDNPNQITRLLYLLVRDKKTEATVWLDTLSNESERTVSLGIMKEYLDGNFFPKQT